MPNKIIALFSDSSIGCTFLDWSIYWLSNKNSFYNIDSANWIPLSTNPVCKINAHGHQKNHPGGNVETNAMISQLRSLPQNNELLSFYMFPKRLYDCKNSLGFSEQPVTDKVLSAMLGDQSTDFVEMWDSCNAPDVSRIFVEYTGSPVYFSNVRAGKESLISGKYLDVNEIDDDYLDTYFKESSAQFGSNIWDKREFLSLNVRPFSYTRLDTSMADFSSPYLHVNAYDLWFNGESIIRKIMDYVGVSIDYKRYTEWTEIYSQWRQLQGTANKFCWNLDTICDSIVNNKYLDLSDFNLSLRQEAIIQHVILYKYGLTFKGWGIEKFPTNTKELHKLLEPNVFHDIEDIYNTLKGK